MNSPGFSSPALGPFLLGDAIARAARYVAGPSPEIQVLCEGRVVLTTSEHGHFLGELEQAVDLHARCATGCPEGECSERLPMPARDAQGRLVFNWIRCPQGRARVRVKRMDRLLTLSRIPEGLREKTLASFQLRTDAHRRAVELVEATLEGTRRGFILAGPTGTGKSHLAAALVNHRLGCRREAVFCKVPELLADLRAGIRTDRTEGLVSLLRQFELVVLDDLGAERPTEFSSEQLYRIVDGRLLDGRQTVATTNFVEPSALAARLGDYHGQRIVSRLREASTWLVLGGRDARLGG